MIARLERLANALEHKAIGHTLLALAFIVFVLAILLNAWGF
jgi:hypothetical protein